MGRHGRQSGGGTHNDYLVMSIGFVVLHERDSRLVGRLENDDRDLA